MRPSGAPQDVGLEAGFAGTAGVASATVPIASCAKPGMRASARSTDSSNTISLIRFFNAVLLFVVSVGSNPACGTAPDFARPDYSFPRAPSRSCTRNTFARAARGPRSVGLGETHPLIEGRMIVEPEFHGCRWIWFFQVHLA